MRPGDTGEAVSPKLIMTNCSEGRSSSSKDGNVDPRTQEQERDEQEERRISGEIENAGGANIHPEEEGENGQEDIQCRVCLEDDDEIEEGRESKGLKHGYKPSKEEVERGSRSCLRLSSAKLQLLRPHCN